MRKRSHTTLDDIAKRLKVSRVTVSKALRGHPDISAEMTLRVREVAAKLNYTPNIIARSLSSRRSHMIGLVVPKVAHFFFSAVIEGVYNTTFEHNYETIMMVSQENAEREKKHLQTLVAMRVDGIIISISQNTDDPQLFQWIRQLGIPLLFVDRRPEPPLPGFSSVLVADREGACMAVEQAINVGYRKLGFVGGNPKVNIGKNRLLGFEDAHNKHHLQINRDWIVQAGYGKEDGYKGLMQLYRNRPLPEFVLAATYPVALGIYEAAKTLGIRIPDDIDVICFGDSDVGRFLSPAISVVRQPTHELGSKAAQMLLDFIASPDTREEEDVILPAELVMRETCVARRSQVTGSLSQGSPQPAPQVQETLSAKHG
jgi:LacI family transcriptional regulator